MYDADAAREALEEARRFDKGNGAPDEKAESWALAAERFEAGLTIDSFAASHAILCWRKAGDWSKALACAETALEYFGGDPWVRNHAAWVQYDRLKEIGRNLDEALPVLEQMLELMRGINDVGILADSAFYRLRALIPYRGAAPPDVLDFLVRHFEQLFDGCSSLRRDNRESPKQQLAQLAATHLEQHERWDDVVVTMQRVVQAFPREAGFAKLYVRALLEMREYARALDAANDALLELADAELVRLQARALASLQRYEEAEQALLAGCYRFPDIWLWRDLAKVRWHLGDLDGSNRALAVALRQLAKRPERERRELEPELHQGRAAGLVQLGQAEAAAEEAVAARLAYERAGREPKEGLRTVIDRLTAEHPAMLDAADDLAEAGQLAARLAERYAAEREREVEAGLKAADIVHIDSNKGFGHLTLADLSPDGSNPHDRIYFTFKVVQGGGGESLAVGSRVRVLATPITNSDAKQFSAAQRAVIVRLDES